jgi:YgiT-type zinc finger domain-containing protein
MADLEIWRRAHPRATFAEIEAAVEERIGVLRAELIAQELALRAAAEVAEAAGTAGRCPTCGGPTQARGTRERSLTVRGNRPVRLRRRYMVCPACGTGHFPPR